MLRPALLAALLFAFPSAPALARVVSSADEACVPTADPCVVAGSLDVAAGSVLDFGLRTLRIEGAGSLGFAGGSAEVRCGRLEVATGGTALRLRGADAASSPSATFVVRGRCGASRLLPCLVDADCAGHGACDAGRATATIAGAILGTAEFPGRVAIVSAGDLRVDAPVAIAASRAAGDGGSLTLGSTLGGAVVAGRIDLSGGSLASGGSLEVSAAQDVVLDAPVFATGGDYDGGSVTLEAGRDALVHDDVAVDSAGGSGFGGEIDVEAGRDVRIDGGTSTRPLRIGADGHQSVDDYGGDGGTIAIDAGRDAVLAGTVRIAASGAAPDGYADTIEVAAGRDIAFDATVVAGSRGSRGGGGLLDLEADGVLRTGPAAFFDLAGAAAGGDLMATGWSGVELGARVDVTTAASGVGGRVVAVTRGDAEVTGDWATSGADSSFSVGELFVEGCRVHVASTLANGAASGRNRIVASGGIVVDTGAALLASGAGGSSELRVRDAATELRLGGRAEPSPSVVVDPELPPCAACAGASCDAEGLCARLDACGAGACPAAGLDVAMLRVRHGRGAARARLKATIPVESLPADPAVAGLRVAIAGDDGTMVFDAALAAGALVPRGGRWTWSADDATPAAGAAPASIASASVAVVARAGFARVKLELEGDALDAALSTPSLALVLDDATGDVACVPSSPLSCAAASGGLVCRPDAGKAAR